MPLAAKLAEALQWYITVSMQEEKVLVKDKMENGRISESSGI